MENLGADEMMKLTWENMDLFNLNQKMDNWHVIIHTVREFHFPYNSRIFYFCETTIILIFIVEPCILKSTQSTHQQIRYVLNWLKVLNLH